jgi:peroxiredoxin family protein
MGEDTKRLALVASKGTLDMAYPPLILASTAASLGWEAGIFFTFYGLDIITKKRVERLPVAPVGNPAMPPPFEAIPFRVPTLMGALPGMTAVATGIMKGWIARAKLPTIPELLEACRAADVRLFACATTMGLMGVAEEDLIEGAACAGAATFLDFASEADVSLFV